MINPLVNYLELLRPKQALTSAKGYVPPHGKVGNTG